MRGEVGRVSSRKSNFEFFLKSIEIRGLPLCFVGYLLSSMGYLLCQMGYLLFVVGYAIVNHGLRYC